MSCETVTSSTSASTSETKRGKWARLPMAAVLALAFGAMLVVSLGTIITTSIYTAAQNTRQLLTMSLNLTLDAIESGVAGYLSPIEDHLRTIRSKMITGELSPALDDGTRQYFAGILDVSPQLSGIAIVERGGSMKLQHRLGWTTALLSPLRPETEAVSSVEDRSLDQVTWGRPGYSEPVGKAIIYASILLVLEDDVQYEILAGVDLETFAGRLNELAVELGRPVFALDDEERLLGHNGFRPSAAGLSQPESLLHVSEASDPVLAAFESGEDDRIRTVAPDFRGSGREVIIDGVYHHLVFREMGGGLHLPWTVGTHLPAEEAGEQVRRVFQLIALAAVVVLLSLASTWWIGRLLSRPVTRLATFAEKVGELEMDDLEPLPPSGIRELNTASSAFNGMTNALRWFGAYVPRKMVRSLVLSHGAEGIPSEERDITVMFTDIVGFTSTTSPMSPEAVAAFINAHFAVLQACIEAEDGTIDKYIGDSVMAFWGAPSSQPDHALRACRAALAIRDALAATPDAPSIRIGINTGPVLVGNIGAPGRLNYTIVGEAVNIAQRVEQLGRRHDQGTSATILITGETARRIEGTGVEVESLGTAQVKGLSEPLAIGRL